MIEYSEYDKETAIKHMRGLDKHNGYRDFLSFIEDGIILKGKIPQIEHPSTHAARYVMDYFRKKGIEPSKENYRKINIHLGGVKAAAEAFPPNASFDEIAELSEAVLAEGLKPWDSGFMKRVWEKKKNKFKCF